MWLYLYFTITIYFMHCIIYYICTHNIVYVIYYIIYVLYYILFYFFLFLKLFFYLLVLEREEGGEREREHQCERETFDQLPPVQVPTHVQDWTYDLGMFPDGGSNPQPFGVWEDDPINWATWPGPISFFFL